MKKASALMMVALMAALALSCRKEEVAQTAPPAQETPSASPVSYTAEIEAWQKRRQDNLRKEDSWFTVVGLWWLNEGKNAFGSDQKNPVKLPAGKGPALAGTFTLDKGKLRIDADPAAGIITTDGKPVTTLDLKTDADGDPTELHMGRVSFYAIKRDDRVAIRVKDPDSEARKNFKGLEYYPIDPAYRIEARWEPYNPPKKVAIDNVVGQRIEYDVPGAIVFELDGKTHRIDPIVEEGDDQLFVIFGDETNGPETYPAGRYLYTDVAKDGKVLLDLNKAYNPPCAFTDFATCPLPPRQNRLAVHIRAGEKKYALHPAG
jgi:uncharacterized protein (DUF1684 family)